MLSSATPLAGGAMMATLTVLLGLGALYLPLVGAVALFAAPVPLALAFDRYGLRTGVLASVTAAVLLLILAGPLAAAGLVLGALLWGVVLGLGLLRRWSGTRLLLAAAATGVAGVLLTYLLGRWVTGIDPLLESARMFQEALQQAAGMTQEVEIRGRLRAQAEQIPELIRRLLPALIVIGGSMAGAVQFWTSGLILRRLDRPLPAVPPFTQWRFPPWLLYLYLAGILLQLSQAFLQDQPYWQAAAAGAGLNLIVFAQSLMIVQGLAAMNGIMLLFKVHRALGIGLSVLMLLDPLLNQLLVLFGMVVTVFDLRAWLARRRAG